MPCESAVDLGDFARLAGYGVAKDGRLDSPFTKKSGCSLQRLLCVRDDMICHPCKRLVAGLGSLLDLACDALLQVRSYRLGCGYVVALEDVPRVAIRGRIRRKGS